MYCPSPSWSSKWALSYQNSLCLALSPLSQNLNITVTCVNHEVPHLLRPTILNFILTSSFFKLKYFPEHFDFKHCNLHSFCKLNDHIPHHTKQVARLFCVLIFSVIIKHTIRAQCVATLASFHL
jgi:hypothetical protein